VGWLEHMKTLFSANIPDKVQGSFEEWLELNHSRLATPRLKENYACT
jgi:hypothetical protein